MMNTQPMRRMAPDPAAEREHRHTQTLMEIRQMHEDYRNMGADLQEARATIERLLVENKLLREDRDQCRLKGEVYQRKLIRLSTEMAGISKLAIGAVEIMNSRQEIDDYERETKAQAEEEQRAAAQIVADLRRLGHKAGDGNVGSEVDEGDRGEGAGGSALSASVERGSSETNA